jgi:cytoskeletal protein CcmA (bactofilin family)
MAAIAWLCLLTARDLGATAFVQLTPNDAEKIIYIRNSLSGSRSVILFQGTYNASNDYEVPAGTTAVVYFDGAGAGAVAANVFNNAHFDAINVVGTVTATTVTATTVNATTVDAVTVEFDNLSGTGAVSVTNILDEDNMASDSATALATQQSIKAYVDAQVATVDTLAEILAIGNTTGATDIDVDGAQKVQFRDAAIYINSSVDGQLDIVADTEIQIAATTVDLNGNLDVSGTLGVTGVLTATSLDISGDIDVDGTTNLDVVDIDGAVDMASTLLVTGVLTTTAATVSNGGGQFNGAINVGVDDTGYDVKFFGATAGAYMLWDESADDLILGGAAGLSVNSTALVTGVLTTTAATVHTGGITMPDNAKAIFGAGSDLEIYHDGSNSIISEAGTGILSIRASAGTYIQKYDGTETMAYFAHDDGVYLYYDNALKLATTATGIDVTGTAVTDGLTVSGNLSVDGGTIKLDGNYPVGTGNLALGDQALDSNVSGGYNTAIGNLALTSCTSNYHTVVGSFAGQNLTTALASGAIGAYALYSNTTGPYNYAFGNSALQVNTTGGYNTAIGSTALTSNTTASNNTAVGYQALYANTTGGSNVAVGRGAADSTTTGSYITAIGNNALGANTTGNRNTAVGPESLSANTTGVSNVAVGSYNDSGGVATLAANTTGNFNTALGASALGANTTADSNTAVGYQAGYSNTTGARISFLGFNSGYENTTGFENVAMGAYSFVENTTGSANTALGDAALNANTTASNNTAVGSESLKVNTTGAANTALGKQSLWSNTTASNNTAVGYQALYANTTGSENIAVGFQSLDANISGSNNVGMGYAALGSNTTGFRNVAVGSNNGALSSNTTGNDNVALGADALYSNTTAINNTAVGYQAGYSCTVDGGQTMVGYQAGLNTTGLANTFFGNGAGSLVTSGLKNTILGRYDGNQGSLDIRTSDNNIVLSDGDGNPRMRVDNGGLVSIGAATSPYGGTRLYLENIASASALFQVNNTHNVSGDVNSQIWLGSNCNNTSSYFLLCGIVGVANQMYVYGNGNIVNTNNSYGAISDVKLKENIIDATSQWDDIKNLTVRKYSMKADNLDAPNRLGVIAQEVEAAGMGGLVFESPDRDLENNVLDTVTKHVNYSILYMKAVKALQEAMTRIETLEAQNASFEARITALES